MTLGAARKLRFDQSISEEFFSELICSGRSSYCKEGTKTPKSSARSKQSRPRRMLTHMLFMDFWKIRRVHSNLNAIHHHVETTKQALCFIIKTQISSPADVSYLDYPGYNMKHSFEPYADVCIYVLKDSCCRRFGNLEVGGLGGGESVPPDRIEASACFEIGRKPAAMATESLRIRGAGRGGGDRLMLQT
ncbi:hypothetical protein EVAR_94531_1 [Eumeta japonica]|uniref:Uncharacterized protein n=1 Tax=Eumeta variegata TaxID=151549 RepID=A0A4C1UUP8_EUMVA|nr:hypothetical protein EVAR_94531_1 [Eumeta japonica]